MNKLFTSVTISLVMMAGFLQDNSIGKQSIMQKEQSSDLIQPVKVELEKIKISKTVSEVISPNKPATVVASYYGGEKKGDFHGKVMANGERFNKNDTVNAAHRELPFGTKLTLKTDLDTDEKLVVVIEDRGPFKSGRQLDVSLAAARKLGLIEGGVGSLYVTKIELPRNADISLNQALALLKRPYSQS